VINDLPQNITTCYRGVADGADVINIISRYDLYVLLTSGENFGHTIFQALSASVPVLISDQTPWRQLREKKAGWDLPISNIEGFTRALEIAASWDNTQIKEQKTGAYNVAYDYASDRARIQTAQKLFI
jgi:glycosyltransferase involved in cell wall biosynthesis